MILFILKISTLKHVQTVHKTEIQNTYNDFMYRFGVNNFIK